MAERAVPRPQLGCCAWRGKERGLHLLFCQWSLCLSQGPNTMLARARTTCSFGHGMKAVSWHCFWWFAKHNKQRPSRTRKLRQTREMQIPLISIAILYQLSLWQLSAAWKGAITWNPLLQTGKVRFFCFFLTMQFKRHLIDINISVRKIFSEYNIQIQGIQQGK